MPKASDNKASDNKASGSPAQPVAPEAATAFARVRWLMIVSVLTTALAVVAVIGVIGYRVYTAKESGISTITNGTVFLPKGAHVDSTTVEDGRIVVTFDVGGVSAVRMFDVKTLRQVGQLNFATER